MTAQQKGELTEFSWIQKFTVKSLMLITNHQVTGIKHM